MDEFSSTFKVIWSKTSIGISVDRIQGQRTSFPLTTFYFWPRENGWKLLKADLDSKPWMTINERHLILNGFTFILHYWVANSSANMTTIFQDSRVLNFRLLASI